MRRDVCQGAPGGHRAGWEVTHPLCEHHGGPCFAAHRGTSGEGTCRSGVGHWSVGCSKDLAREGLALRQDDGMAETPSKRVCASRDRESLAIKTRKGGRYG